MQNYHTNKSSPRVRLDDYICDLNLEVLKGGYICKPLSSDGFSYMWAGSKATYGIRSGKVCFEVKILDYNEVTCKDVDTHVVRVGWSTDDATLQLGEDKNSFGFGGTGKKSVNRKFANYGRRFEKGDVVGCYLAMENGWVDISYSVNGRFCASAFKIRWMTDEALFPHILTKNCKLEINFGQASHPYFSLQPGYKLIDHVPPEFLIPGMRSPLSQKDCEVIMMVGLPGVGKSTWAMNFAKIHPSKKYNILGTDSIIEKMRVQGLPRKNNFSGRWDVLIKQASDCFNSLLKKASNLPRNLILDQTNVYASARRRKVKQYREKGYTINAMVLLPRDEDMIRRSEQRTLEEGKEVPQAAVLDMKANFSLPHDNEHLFDKITFLELQREDAQVLVEQYNREAMSKGHQSNMQKGQSRHMNQTERNRYFSAGSSGYQSDNYSRQQQGYSSKSEDSYQNSRSYEEESREIKKRPDTSSYGPPEKYRRSDSPSTLIRQGYPGSQPYASGYQQDPYKANTAGQGADQWGSASAQAPSSRSAKREPQIKEEVGHPLSRGDARPSYGRPPVKSESYSSGWGQDQYGNVKTDPNSYENNSFPRQDNYEANQGYTEDQYYSQSSQQSVPPKQEYQQARPAGNAYSSVKAEPNTTDSWYDQGARTDNYSAGDASYKQPQDSYQQQQGGYYDTQYGANQGYEAKVKTEDWGGQQRPQPQAFNEQQFDSRSANRSSNQYASANYDSYSERSNTQQWNQPNANQNYNEGNRPPNPNQRQPESAPSRDTGARPDPMQQNQYGDYQNSYSYSEQNRDTYGGDQGFTGRREDVAYPKQEYGYSSNQGFNQMKSQPDQTVMAQGDRPYPSGTSNYGSNTGAQDFESRSQYGQQNWNAGMPTPMSDSWEQRNEPQAYKKPSPLPMRREPDRPAYQQRDAPVDRSAANTRQPETPWSGQNKYPQEPVSSRFGDTRAPKPFEERRPSALLPTPMDQQRPSEHLDSAERRPQRVDRDMSPRGAERNHRPDPRPVRREDGPPRRGDREEPVPRRGERDDSYQRRGRDAPRRSEREDVPPRHSERSDILPRRSEREDSSSRRSTKDPPSRRNDRDDSRIRPSDRSRDVERDRSSGGRDSSRTMRDRRDENDRDKPRDDGRRGDSRSSREDSERSRGRRDRPPQSREERRPREDRGRSNEHQDRKGSATRKPDESKPSLKPSEPPLKSQQVSTPKLGLLPLPNQPSSLSPTDKAGLSKLTPIDNKLTEEIALSKLASVDFDKLKASLVSIREQNKKVEGAKDSPKKQPISGTDDDMDLVPDEELNQPIKEPPTAAPLAPRMPMVQRPRRPPQPRVSLLGPRPHILPRGPTLRPRMGPIRNDAPGLRGHAPRNIPPAGPDGVGILGRPPPRRPLLETPRFRNEMPQNEENQLDDDVMMEFENEVGYQEGARMAPRPPRPHMMRPRLRGVRPPPGVRMMTRGGFRPRMRPPGPRGYGRPPLMRGVPRRPPVPRLGPM